MKKKVSQPPGRPTRVIAYIRVSTEQQAVDGNSLEAQRAKLEAYAGAFGIEIVAVCTDAGVSASTLDRPGLQAALASLKAGDADGLLVVKLDRLSRRLRDMCELVDRYFKPGGFALMSVSESIDTSTLTGRLILNVLTAVAEWEREAAAERTQAVMQHMKATGKFTGGWPPFGFRIDEDGALIDDPVEQLVIRQAKALRANGLSLRKIATTLNVNPNTGKPYSASQIARML